MIITIITIITIILHNKTISLSRVLVDGVDDFERDEGPEHEQHDDQHQAPEHGLGQTKPGIR